MEPEINKITKDFNKIINGCFYSINFIDLMLNKDNKFFTKLFKWNNNVWELIGFGYLKIDGVFVLLESKEVIFSYSDYKMRLFENKGNYIKLAGDNGDVFLLYHYYQGAIRLLMS